MEGYLMKGGEMKDGKRKWKKRYFQFKEDVLYTFRDASGEAQVGDCQITGSVIRFLSDDPYVFALVADDNEMIILQASSSDDAENWMAALHLPMAINATDAKFSGYCKRKGKSGKDPSGFSWRKRWMQLKDGKFYVFKDQPKGEDDYPIGEIPLESSLVTLGEANSHELIIANELQPHFCVRFASSDELFQWIDAMKPRQEIKSVFVRIRSPSTNVTKIVDLSNYNSGASVEFFVTDMAGKLGIPSGKKLSLQFPDGNIILADQLSELSLVEGDLLHIVAEETPKFMVNIEFPEQNTRKVVNLLRFDVVDSLHAFLVKKFLVEDAGSYIISRPLTRDVALRGDCPVLDIGLAKDDVLIFARYQEKLIVHVDFPDDQTKKVVDLLKLTPITADGFIEHLVGKMGLDPGKYQLVVGDSVVGGDVDMIDTGVSKGEHITCQRKPETKIVVSIDFPDFEMVKKVVLSKYSGSSVEQVVEILGRKYAGISDPENYRLQDADSTGMISGDDFAQCGLKHDDRLVYMRMQPIESTEAVTHESRYEGHVMVVSRNGRSKNRYLRLLQENHLLIFRKASDESPTRVVVYTDKWSINADRASFFVALMDADNTAELQLQFKSLDEVNELVDVLSISESTAPLTSPCTSVSETPSPTSRLPESAPESPTTPSASPTSPSQAKSVASPSASPISQAKSVATDTSPSQAKSVVTDTSPSQAKSVVTDTSPSPSPTSRAKSVTTDALMARRAALEERRQLLEHRKKELAKLKTKADGGDMAESEKEERQREEEEKKRKEAEEKKREKEEEEMKRKEEEDAKHAREKEEREKEEIAIQLEKERKHIQQAAREAREKEAERRLEEQANETRLQEQELLVEEKARIVEEKMLEEEEMKRKMEREIDQVDSDMQEMSRAPVRCQENHTEARRAPPPAAKQRAKRSELIDVTQISRSSTIQSESNDVPRSTSVSISSSLATNPLFMQMRVINSDFEDTGSITVKPIPSETPKTPPNLRMNLGRPRRQRRR